MRGVSPLAPNPSEQARREPRPLGRDDASVAGRRGMEMRVAREANPRDHGTKRENTEISLVISDAPRLDVDVAGWQSGVVALEHGGVGGFEVSGEACGVEQGCGEAIARQLVANVLEARGIERE